jgi:hypothetical protein
LIEAIGETMACILHLNAKQMPHYFYYGGADNEHQSKSTI